MAKRCVAIVNDSVLVHNCRNRRVTFLVLDRLHGIKDGQSYQDEGWFAEKFLPHYTNQRGKAIWFDKYLDVIRRPR